MAFQRTRPLYFLVLLGTLVSAAPEGVAKRSISDVCGQISTSISSASSVYYPPSSQYTADNEHWAASSTQSSTCSVEPGNTADVGVILQILGSTGTPFAVKGGGHTANPGFSSTTGVQIAMTRFNRTVYNETTSTAIIGTGQIWDEVYATLAPYNVNVVGGRVTGVGVAGFTLGGGYSWISNQYGLTIDNVVSYELVLPNGTVTTVTSANPDLFFALKGGYNNFGIVTRFTLKTYPQTQVWGGLITYTSGSIPALETAVSNFVTNNTDPKAVIIAAFNTLLAAPGVTLSIFYNAPTVPAGVFDEILAIPSFTRDVKTRSFLSLVQSSPSNFTAGRRGAFHMVPLTKYSPNLMKVIVNETKFWGSNAASFFNGLFTSYDVESFLPSIFAHGADSAYPPDRSRGLLPLNIYYAWTPSNKDSYYRNAMVQSANTIAAAADAEGQDIGSAALYGNYAISSTPVSKIFGANLARLQSIKAQYDPRNVMGLAGGWKV